MGKYIIAVALIQGALTDPAGIQHGVTASAVSLVRSAQSKIAEVTPALQQAAQDLKK